MSDLVNVRDIETGLEHRLAQPGSIEPALLFKDITDQIWASRPEDWPLSYWHSQGEIADSETVRDEINRAVLPIDASLAIVGMDKAVSIGRGSNKVELTPEHLVLPVGANVHAYVWDRDSRTVREVDLGGRTGRFQILDSYAREIGLSMFFDMQPDRLLSLTYSINRSWAQRSKPARISLSAYDPYSIETGYEGDMVIEGTPMTTEQELDVLRAFAKLGGLALTQE